MFSLPQTRRLWLVQILPSSNYVHRVSFHLIQWRVYKWWISCASMCTTETPLTACAPELFFRMFTTMHCTTTGFRLAILSLCHICKRQFNTPTLPLRYKKVIQICSIKIKNVQIIKICKGIYWIVIYFMSAKVYSVVWVFWITSDHRRVLIQIVWWSLSLPTQIIVRLFE